MINGGVLLYTVLNDFLSPSKRQAMTGMDVLFKQYWYYLVLAVVMSFANIMCRSSVYSTMMKTLTGKFKFPLCVSTTIIGKFYDNVTPLSTGGQPFQIYHLQKKKLLTPVPAATEFEIKRKCRNTSSREWGRIWSGWRDLNPRPHAPETCTLPTALHPD